MLLLITTGIFINFRHCPHVFRRLFRAALHQKYIPASDIRFRWNGAQGYNSRGPHGSTSDSSVLKSSDCVIVERIIHRFPSASDAEIQFSEWVESASKVIAIAPQNDQSGFRRAVLQTDGHDFDIISKGKDSSIIYSVWSKSLEHAALLEKQDQLRRSATKLESLGQ